MLGLFKRRRSKQSGRERVYERAYRMLRARYDAAQTVDDNRRHWANADGLSARAANSPGVRRILRNRARYEVANNSYAKGIVLTLANDVIGTGPRLQLLSPRPEVNRIIEREFARWAKAVDLAGKLRTMRMARASDGESFGLLTTNPSLPTDVKLDLKVFEADQVTTPLLSLEALQDPRRADGIVFDADGNPREYHVLKQHPGDLIGVTGFNLDFDRVPAESMIHLYRADRPGQARGVPELTPALPLFAQLRRFTLATIAAAETAADFAGLLHTDAPSEDPDEVEPFLPIELEQRALMSLPHGWRVNQLKAEHPATTYDMFVAAILREIARCLNMPFNVAAGDSSGYNYSSGRLDHQTYFKAIQVEQSHLEAAVLDALLAAWFDEAALVPGVLPDALGVIAEIDHQWFFDGHEHVDPQKEARGQELRLGNGTTTRAREYARMGLDVDEEDRKAAESYGVTVEEYRRALFAKHFSGGSSSEDEAEEEELEEAA